MRSAWVRGGMALALAALLAPALLAGDRGEVIEERSFDVGPGSTLSFDSDSGGVTIQGESRDDIFIQVRARGMDVEDARDALELTFQETAGGLEVKARIRRGGWLSNLFGGDRGGIHYDVRVPRRTNLLIDNGSGGVSAEEIDGSVSVDNGSGGIHLRHIVGDVTVDNGSGGIRVEHVQGRVRIDNGSGGVRAEDLLGDVNVDNGSGGVHLERVEGALDVETSSGGVRVEMVGRNAGIRAETSSGEVRIRVPSGWGADLELRTGSGDIVLSGWPEIDLGDAHRFRGSVGGGGPKITLTSSSGDVELIAG